MRKPKHAFLMARPSPFLPVVCWSHVCVIPMEITVAGVKHEWWNGYCSLDSNWTVASSKAGELTAIKAITYLGPILRHVTRPRMWDNLPPYLESDHGHYAGYSWMGRDWKPLLPERDEGNVRLIRTVRHAMSLLSQVAADQGRLDPAYADADFFDVVRIKDDG